jgi:hypothetical protein
MMERALRKELTPPTVADDLGLGARDSQTALRAQQACVRELRSELQNFEEKSNAIAMTLFVVDAAVYVACFLCLAWLPGHLILKAFLSVIFPRDDHRCSTFRLRDLYCTCRQTTEKRL